MLEKRLTSGELADAKLSTIRFRAGYEPREVDDFLNSVAESLQAWESRRRGKLRAEDLLNARFTPTNFRSGYNMNEVDILLDSAAASLRYFEERYSAGEYWS